MATLAQAVLRRGVAFGGSPHGLPGKASVACFSRGMSTSETARITGSVLGNHSVKVRGDKVSKAMEEVERREKIARLNEMMERRAFHEKGFEKTRRRKKFKKWNAEYKAATAQHNWMTFLKEKGVPIPGQKRRTS
eukprot:jgi/Undpi1/177/HiC_scaffold_1.g00174.m1